MIKIITALLIALLSISPAAATFNYTGLYGSGGANPIVNPGFETTGNWTEYEAAWNWTPHALTDYTTEQAQSGTRSYKIVLGHTDGEDAFYDGIYQAFTVTPNTQYTFKAWVRDTTASSSVKMIISTAAKGAGTVHCTATETNGNINVWSQLTCTVPNTNTASTLYVNFLPIAYALNTYGYIDNVTLEVAPDTGKINLTLPTGSAGRVASLVSEAGLRQTITASGNSVLFTGVTSGLYYLSVTDVDGKTFRDNSAFVSMTPATASEEWAWTDANLSKDATWDLSVRGDSNTNGNCLDNGDTGCYTVLTRNGTDFAFLGPALGNNLAAGKTVSVSSGTGASNVVDGNKNTYWAATSTANEWVCVDLGQATTFNKIVLYRKNGDYANNFQIAMGPRNLDIKVSTADTDCSAGTWSVVEAFTPAELGKPILPIAFTAQTKRFVRLDIATFGTGSGMTNGSLMELEVYNEGASNSGSDIDFLTVVDTTTEGTPRAQVSVVGVKWDAYTVGADGSTTFTKTLSSPFQVSISVNYRKIADTWRKRFTVTSAVTSKMRIKSGVVKYTTPSTPCFAAIPYSKYYTTNIKTCDALANQSTRYNEVVFAPPALAFGFPEAFTLAADDGCRGKYYSNTDDFGQHAKSHDDIAAIERDAYYTELAVQYGNIFGGTEPNVLDNNQDGKPDFILIASQPYEFDIAISRSLNPDGNEAAATAIASIGDMKEKTNFDAHGKLLYGSARGRIATTVNQNVCISIHHRDHNKGMHGVDNTWSLIGMNDRDLARDMVYAWRRGTPETTHRTIVYGDTFSGSQTSTSFTRDYKDPVYMAYLLGYVASRGWITAKADCSNTDRTCIHTVERDGLYSVINSMIVTNGEVMAPWGYIIPIGASRQTNTLDVMGQRLMQTLIAYRSMKLLGSSVDESKLANMKAVAAALYNTDNGYIDTAKYGPWRPIVDAAASGGTYRYSEFDPEPATARFVVPSGTNVAASFKYKAGGNYGKMDVKKNGTAVTGSPFDLYNPDYWNTYSGPYESIYVSGGLQFVVGGTQRSAYGANADIPSIEGHIPFGIHYKDVTDFSGTLNRIQVRVKSPVNGPTGMTFLYTDGVDCTGYAWKCAQYFPSVITADNTWQTIEMIMTDAEWSAGDIIGNLRVQFMDSSSPTAVVEMDWMKVTDGTTPTTLDDYSIDGPFKEQALTETVSAGDVLTFSMPYTGGASRVGVKNASSSDYFMSLDAVIVNGTTYEENNAAFQCGNHPFDCKDGYSLGWKRWKSNRVFLWEIQMRVLFSDPVFTNAQLISHLEHMEPLNPGYGSLMSYISTERGYPVPTYYWGDNFNYGNDVEYLQFNGAPYLNLDQMGWYGVASTMGDAPLWYTWDEKSDKFQNRHASWVTEVSGNSGNLHNTSTYLGRLVWKSATAGATMEFKDVAYTDVQLYAITGSGQGTVKVYFAEAGGAYDAGTTVDLSAGAGGGTRATSILSKTGLTHLSTHKIKIEVVSGTVRVDYARAKTKPSQLMEYRFELEYKVVKTVKNWIAANYGNGNTPAVDYLATGTYSEWTHLDIFYRGSALQSIKRKFWRDNMFFRRLPQ